MHARLGSSPSALTRTVLTVRPASENMHLRLIYYATGISFGVFGIPLLPPFRLGSGASVPPELPPFSPQQRLNSVAPSNGELPAPLHAAPESHALRPSLRGGCHGHALCQPMTSTSPITIAPLSLSQDFLRPYGGSLSVEARYRSVIVIVMKPTIDLTRSPLCSFGGVQRI